MGTTNFTVRLEDADKIQAEEVFEKLGLSMSAGINVYVKAVARLRKIPFALRGQRTKRNIKHVKVLK